MIRVDITGEASVMPIIIVNESVPRGTFIQVPEGIPSVKEVREWLELADEADSQLASLGYHCPPIKQLIQELRAQLNLPTGEAS